MNNETFFNLLLPHLKIDVVYRLYPFSKDLRRMVDNRFYWLKLIERDLKMIPKFEINTKLYYLRLMNYPIAGTLMSSRLNPIGGPIYTPHRNNKVLQYLEGVILYRNNKIEFLGQIISLSESIKFVRKVFRNYYAIAYSGRVYNLIDYTNPETIFGAYVLDISVMPQTSDTVIVMTHSGELKLFKFFKFESGATSMVPLSRIDLSKYLDSKSIQLRNGYVMTDKGTMYSIGTLFTNSISTPIMRECTSLLPRPCFGRGVVYINTWMLGGNKETPYIYSPNIGRCIVKKFNSHIFIDPLGGDLLGPDFEFDLGDRPILEVCNSGTTELILRTL